MRKISLIWFISVIPLVASVKGQEILTLKECYEKAYITSALAGERVAYSDIWRLKDKNLSRGWLPVIDANGTFVYNSSVVDMNDVLGSLPLPDTAGHIEPLPHEQYKITLDINQTIYDGGAIKSARAIEKAGLTINEKQIESDLYTLRGQINTYYFNLLLLDKQKDLLQSYLQLINKRISSMTSALKSGVILASDLDILQSEKLKLEQQLTEYNIRKGSLLKIMTDITGIAMDSSTVFVIPVIGEVLTSEFTRPELEIFDLQKEQLEASRQLIQSKRMPKAFVFGTFGYGNPPGSNFFVDEFAPYYLVGAGLKWNIYDWDKAKNEKSIITLQQNIIDSRKSNMTDNLQRLLDAKNAEIISLESLLKTDTELIELRKRITSAAESKYENGTITATEYLNELNSEKQALINFEMHKINLAMARVEYMNISGKDIE